MPAVTPADVQTSPSRTKIGSGSTFTPGYRAASASQESQCVVARRPSRRPASASRKAPEQTDAVRRASREAAPIQSMSARSRIAARVPKPPTTISVSIGLSASAKAVWGRIASPLLAASGSRVAATTSVR
jgi:hypothetical protein